MKDDEEGDPRIVVCQGPPKCDYNDAKPDGRTLPCPWCTIITCHPDLTETVQQPGNA